MPELRTEDVHVLDFGDGENRFSPSWLDEVSDALDKVVAAPAPLVTVGGGKFYSNGLDVEWMTANGSSVGGYVRDVQALLARVLTLPVPTVAAVNGHAFGAGAMLALAHDFRVSRAKRGYFCLPEVDIRLPFTPGMAALVQAKLTPAAAISTMTTGRRLGGEEAAALAVVDEATEDFLPRARARAAELAGKDPGTLGAIKTTMFGAAAAALRDAG
ncbi:enoyl-CoA hydratase-related protein [Amycolatopsis sp. CA-230715]|uniref:enoyl-CoA hydratase-related protein n=1 Tax=Amycolatopsis sp. CA-230715 TaxID=2745196 RepID=UPI001C00C8F6|nr:enoyl-CoA hydratase-related protein [Amycolatopsis sp. CA-230715]QWF81519.1 Carnitinyl-CoA dehydratase [Amycolatopsis sp. CA-230715]